jgi:hypothetical protein
MVPCSTNFQITNTTDTSLSCGAESYYWEIVNYFEGFVEKGFPIILQMALDHHQKIRFLIL